MITHFSTNPQRSSQQQASQKNNLSGKAVVTDVCL